MTDIAFIGRAGSGKSTAAKMLAADGFTHMGFADPIRALGKMHEAGGPSATDWPELIRLWTYQFRIPDVLNTEDVATLEAGILDAFRTYPRVEGKNRDLLQNIGTHVGRGIDEVLWISLLLNRAEKSGGPAVLDDCRFQNEADALLEAGWCLVYIYTREIVLDARYAKLYGAPMTPKQKAHPSEATIPTLRGRCHYVIDNNGDLVDFYNQVQFVREMAPDLLRLAV